jgi:hypothetical protein
MPDLEPSRPTPNSGNSPGPHHGYDPNQPRVPSGHSDGGQWTKIGGGAPAIARREAVVDHSKQESWGSYVDSYRTDGSLAEQRVFNRDRSRIVSEFKPPDDPGDWDERHTVVLPDGTKFTFENSGNVQRIFDGEGNLVSATEWTEEGPRPLPTRELAGGPALAVPLVMALSEAEILAIGAAAVTLFSWLSSRKDPNRTAVLAFKARKYEKREVQGRHELSWVGYVKRDELKGVCKKLDDVQGYTDKAVKDVLKIGDYDGPAVFGTKVHHLIAKQINGLGKSDFVAEVSRIKSKEADARYGEKGSIRIDALENHSDISTVCVYDPKTGKRGLSLPRSNELAETAFEKFKYIPNHIIMIEVRPGQR